MNTSRIWLESWTDFVGICGSSKPRELLWLCLQLIDKICKSVLRCRSLWPIIQLSQFCGQSYLDWVVSWHRITFQTVRSSVGVCNLQARIWRATWLCFWPWCCKSLIDGDSIIISFWTDSYSPAARSTSHWPASQSHSQQPCSLLQKRQPSYSQHW